MITKKQKKWEIINKLRGKCSSRIKPSFTINSFLTNDHRAIANEFNKYFVSIAEKMNKSVTSSSIVSGVPIGNVPDFSKYMNNSIKKMLENIQVNHKSRLLI